MSKTIRTEYTCKHCGTKEFFIQHRGNHTGVYCAECKKWITWLSKKEVEFWEQRGVMIHNEGDIETVLSERPYPFNKPSKFETPEESLNSLCICNTHKQAAVLNQPNMKQEIKNHILEIEETKTNTMVEIPIKYCPYCGKKL